MNFDSYFFHLINGFSHKFWLLDWLGIFLASYINYFLILIAIFLLIKEKNRRQRIYFFCLAALSVILARGIITEIIRFFYYQPRPFLVLQIQPLVNHDITASFPSGHATAYFALALAIFYFLRRVSAQGETFSGRQDKFNQKLGWWCLGMAFLIGLGRIFVGLHWPMDILVGAIIGLGSAFLIKKLLPKID